tara:strand:- start:240 stop:1340 length:1101 start_codon:yes stop_codon:yes gene_type:complete
LANTYQILLNWDKGQAYSERLSAKIVDAEGFTDIDPQCPTGGPDGRKDIICYKSGRKYVVGCYFGNGQKTFAEIRDKFQSDYEGVEMNNAGGFAFVTNQKITPAERISLIPEGSENIEIYHGERVTNILDSPKGYGIRLEYLDIELTKEEQISFLNSHVNLKQEFSEIKELLNQVRSVSNRIAGEIHDRDRDSNRSLAVLPIVGIPFSSRISLEDLLAIQQASLYETQGNSFEGVLGLRKVQVWLARAGADIENAEYVPPTADQVPKLTIELLSWWKEKYMEVLYSSEQEKVLAIAEFHEKFLTIHPFIDGNGRVSRILASLQFKDLLDKIVHFDRIDRNEYFDSLNNARNGNKQKLTEIFKSLIG